MICQKFLKIHIILIFYIVGGDFLFVWCKEETIFGVGAAENWIKILAR